MALQDKPIDESKPHPHAPRTPAHVDTAPTAPAVVSTKPADDGHDHQH